MRRWLVGISMIALVGPWVARGDDVDPDQVIGGLSFRQEVRVTVVNVDVFVRDKDGNPVTDLTRDDFVIKQNGEPVEVSNFAVLDEEIVRSLWQQRVPDDDDGEASEVAPPPPPDAPEVKPVWVVIYVDNENLRPFDRNRVMRNVRSFVIDNLGGPIQMMVVSYERSLKVVEPFTADSRAVTDALRGMKQITGGRIEKDSRRQDIVERIVEVSNENASNDQRYGQQMRLEQDIFAYAQEETADLGNTLRAFNQLIGMLSGLDGRKVVVYVSSGLPMMPGFDLMHQYASTFHDSSVLSRRSQFNRQADYRSLTTAANGQDVTLYAIDASGLNPLEGFEADSRYAMDPTAASIGSNDYQASLEYMAAATGGIAVVNTNDVGRGLARVEDDLYTYYSLGFQIESEDQDKIHRIEVEVPDRADLDVRYRKRFVEKSLESKVQDRVFSSLMVDIDDNPMRVTIESRRAAPAAGSRWTMPVHLSFPLEAIALLPEGDDYVGRVVLFVGARDDEGGSSEIQRQLHQVRVPAADYETAKLQRFGIDVPLLLEEGRHRISVGLMDEVTRQASYEQLAIAIP